MLANHSADSLHPLAMWKPDPSTFARVEHHPDQPTARRAAEEECLERPGSTYVLETEAYIVQRPDWTMTLHVVDKMHPYSADH